MTESGNDNKKNHKQSSAEILMDVLSDPRVRQALKYVQDERFRSERDRLKDGATKRFQDMKKRYRRTRKRDPQTVEQERELSLRLAEVETESAELRVRLAALLKEEAEIRSKLEEI